MATMMRVINIIGLIALACCFTTCKTAGKQAVSKGKTKIILDNKLPVIPRIQVNIQDTIFTYLIAQKLASKQFVILADSDMQTYLKQSYYDMFDDITKSGAASVERMALKSRPPVLQTLTIRAWINQSNTFDSLSFSVVKYPISTGMKFGMVPIPAHWFTGKNIKEVASTLVDSLTQSRNGELVFR